MLWLLVLLDYAAAVTQSLSPASFHPDLNAWSNNGGQYISTQSGSAAYVDFIFNQHGEEYVTLSVDAYGYTGSPTSPAPASYVIQINSIDYPYDGNQPQPVVFTGLNTAYQYRVVVWAPSSVSGVIVNSVVVSRPDPPVSSTSTRPISSTPPSSSAVVASTAQSSSLSASSLSSNPSSSPSSPVASTATSTGTANATSIAGQSLGVPIFVTISGSVVPQESQTSTLVSASSSGSSSPSIGIILGPIAGVIAVMIIAAFIFIRRRNQARRNREESQVDSYLVEAEAQQRSPSIGPGVEKSSSNPSSNLGTSTSGVNDGSVAPPAYVEEERNITPRNDQS